MAGQRFYTILCEVFCKNYTVINGFLCWVLHCFYKGGIIVMTEIYERMCSV